VAARVEEKATGAKALERGAIEARMAKNFIIL
jgi:hypothetical protein